MPDRERQLEYIKQIIKERVFITKKQARIVNEHSHTGLSAWLFDFRSCLLDHDFLVAVSSQLLLRIHKRFPNAQIGGLESASLPLISGIVMLSHLKKQPLNGFYIRKSRKKTGLLRLIEGTLLDNTPIVLIDDLINSGTSILKQITILEKEGKKVSAVYTILQFRKYSYYKILEEKNIIIESLFTLDDFPELNLSLLEETMEPSRPFSAKWVFQAKNPFHELVIPKSEILIQGNFLYFGADNGSLYSLNKDNGEVVWEFKTAPSLKQKVCSSPFIEDDTIMFGSSDGNLYCLYKKNGLIKWVFEEGDVVITKPIADKKYIYTVVQYGLFSKKSALYALDKTSGKVAWKSISSKKITTEAITLSCKGILLIGCQNELRAYRVKDGKLLWSFITYGVIFGSPCLDEKEKMIYVGCMTGWVYAISLEKGLLIWSFKASASIYSTPCNNTAMVFVTSLDKRIYAVDKKNGSLKWMYETRGRIFATPLLYKNTLYIGSNDGILYVLDQLNGVVIKMCQLSERITQKVVIDENRVYVTTSANEVYCLQDSSEQERSYN